MLYLYLKEKYIENKQSAEILHKKKYYNSMTTAYYNSIIQLIKYYIREPKYSEKSNVIIINRFISKFAKKNNLTKKDTYLLRREIFILTEFNIKAEFGAHIKKEEATEVCSRFLNIEEIILKALLN